MLTTPKHILDAQIANNQLLFPWDEWQSEKAYAPADPALQKRLANLSDRANVAFMLACAEWLIHRFDLVSSDPLPLMYVEAAWAANIHTAYCRYMETNDDEWHGPARGPMNLALAMIVDSLWDAQDNTPGEYPAWMSNLVLLVLSDSVAFVDWREHVLARLEQHFPVPEDDPDDLFEEEDTRGEYVPREVFDLGLPFDPSNTNALCEQFLNGLDHHQNRCLHHPDEMLNFEDYEDTPYKMPA